VDCIVFAASGGWVEAEEVCQTTKAMEIERRVRCHDVSHLKARAAKRCLMRRIRPPQSGPAVKGS
jgi:hypothetical protein